MRDETKQKHTVTCMIWHAKTRIKKSTHPIYSWKIALHALLSA